jgi:hypothetical protein
MNYDYRFRVIVADRFGVTQFLVWHQADVGRLFLEAEPTDLLRGVEERMDMACMTYPEGPLDRTRVPLCSWLRGTIARVATSH